MLLRVIIVALALFLFLPNLLAQERTNPAKQDKELGKISWYRDYPAALAASKKEGKPVLMLFQEVPGCATCRNYGHNVLSNPLMTEAIENEFIPLAIFNNKGGKDREILKKYKEPSWNNPVVRIIDEQGTDLVPRIARDYSAKGLLNGMLNALNLYGKEVPEYMKLLKSELGTSSTVETYFKMYCFWTGEKELGSQKGVLSTNAGFMKGNEVVKVEYNPEVLSEKELFQFAESKRMYPIGKDNSYYHSQKDEDYYIKQSSFKYLPLSELQRTKINSALGAGTNAFKYLSPRQQKWLRETTRQQSKVLYLQPFQEAWGIKLSSN